MLIRPFETGDSQAFADLNLAWIEDGFVVEESDREQLNDPQTSIIAKGGRIIVAEIDGEVCGCGAVLPAHIQPFPTKHYVEIVKMAAKASMRGNGIGRAVMTRLIEEARAMHADGIWIETAEKLTAANRLYRSSGFRELSKEEFWPTPYSRCNTQLLLDF